MMAACDTFRSGAVEQLRAHARRLQIPIFEKGYEKDPAIVAKEAIQEAAQIGSDAVLVDTAGRMQLEDDQMDEESEELAALLAAQGVIGKRVDQMESGFMMAIDYMIQLAEKDLDDKHAAVALEGRTVGCYPYRFMLLGSITFEVHCDRSSCSVPPDQCRYLKSVQKDPSTKEQLEEKGKQGDEAHWVKPQQQVKFLQRLAPPLFAAFVALTPIITPPVSYGQAIDVQRGASLFNRACIGCHDAGGNIIQPGATLFLKPSL